MAEADEETEVEDVADLTKKARNTVMSLKEQVGRIFEVFNYNFESKTFFKKMLRLVLSKFD